MFHFKLRFPFFGAGAGVGGGDGCWVGLPLEFKYPLTLTYPGLTTEGVGNWKLPNPVFLSFLTQLG